MINKTNNTFSFTSKIVCTDDLSDYLDIAYSREETIQADENIVKGQRIGTIGVSTCTAGGASNSSLKTGCVFHFCTPKERETGDIFQAISSLKTNHRLPNVLITGGLYPWFLSEEYFNNVATKLQKFKDRMSIIWGQKDNGYTHIHYSGEKDTWTLYHKPDDSSIKLTSLEDLKKMFHIIQISPFDELLIKGKKNKTLNISKT